MMNQTFSIAPLSQKAVLANWIIVSPVILLTFGLAGILIWFIQASQQLRFEVSDGHLQIYFPFYGRKMAKEELHRDQARIVDLQAEPALKPVFRTNGIGLIGLGAGWFRLKNKEKALAVYVSQQRAVYIPTRHDFVLLLCPQDPEKFLAELQK